MFFFFHCALSGATAYNQDPTELQISGWYLFSLYNSDRSKFGIFCLFYFFNCLTTCSVYTFHSSLKMTQHQSQSTSLVFILFPEFIVVLGVGVLKKVLYGEAPPRGPTPYPFLYHFFQKRYPFRIPFIGKGTPFIYLLKKTYE